ncbi:MAG: hypothetical protein QME63_04760 [Actinomycetota bacterium]|nr:hypothetical protein [Actinomycetota bacterium]
MPSILTVGISDADIFFQNRYKSIIVDEDAYLLELIRYIHLNSLRSGIVTDLTTLSSWPFSGYSALAGNAKQSWLETEATLSYFSTDPSVARRKLAEFMHDGIFRGKRPEFTGGGLKRSMLAASNQARQERKAYDYR